MEHLQKKQASPHEAAGDHAKQLAPALSAGDQHAIASAVEKLGRNFVQGAPAGRLLDGAVLRRVNSNALRTHERERLVRVRELPPRGRERGINSLRARTR